MNHPMDPATARLRHDQAVVNLREATQRLIGMCRLKLLDVESIQDQAHVVSGAADAECATRLQMERAEG
jgi:hypothetical protein